MCQFFFFSHQPTTSTALQTPTSCPRIQCNSDSNYPESVQTSQVKGQSLNTTLISDIHHKSVTYTSDQPVSTTSSSGLKICYNNSQNSRKHFTYYYWFIIKTTTEKQPQGYLFVPTIFYNAELLPILDKMFHVIEEEETLFTLLNEALKSLIPKPDKNSVGKKCVDQFHSKQKWKHSKQILHEIHMKKLKVKNIQDNLKTR